MFLQLFGSIFLVHMHLSTLHSTVSATPIAVLNPKVLRRGNGIVPSCVTVVSQLCHSYVHMKCKSLLAKSMVFKDAETQSARVPDSWW